MENRLAENIRGYRKNLGLTQEQLAERLGITLGAVSKWERGSSEPDLGFIMDLAELFHVSVDALIGFSVHGADADSEADRIEELSKTRPVLEMTAEYENALRRFPNHFRIVGGAAAVYQQIGVVYKKEPEMKRAMELYRHAIELISQNKDPKINEILLRNEVAGCWASLKNYRKAVEEYQKNNPTGSNDSRIGLLMIQYEKKYEEGLEYTQRAFISQISDTITTGAGYVQYYLRTGQPDLCFQASEWIVGYLKSLKKDPEKPFNLDKIICLFDLISALILDIKGLTEESEQRLHAAVRLAGEFDEHPVFTLDNTVMLEKADQIQVYDDTGPTAVNGLRNALDDTNGEVAEFVSDAFLQKLEAEIAALAVT